MYNMDFIDRFHLFVRYSLLGFLCLFGREDTQFFTKQLRKVHHIIDINDELDEELQSEDSSACGMAENTFQYIDSNQNSESVGDGEGTQEAESTGSSGEEPDGSDHNEE